MAFAANSSGGNDVTTEIFTDVPLPEYALGSETRFYLYLSCSNGFDRYGKASLARRTPYGDAVLTWRTAAPIGAAAGTCTLSTYDVVNLGLKPNGSVFGTTDNRTDGTTAWKVTLW